MLWVSQAAGEHWGLVHLMVIIRLVQPRGGEDVRGSVQLIDLTRVSPVISRIDEFQSGLVVWCLPSVSVEVCDGEDWGEWWAHYCNYGGPSLAGRAGHYHNNCGSHVKVSGQQRNSHYHPPPPSPSLTPANSLTIILKLYDLLLRRNFLILYQISEYFSYRVRGSENIVELLPVEIKVTFLM